jgi:hypothetical protein
MLCFVQVLDHALEEYKQRHADENTDPDEMILSAGDYLLRVLEPVQQQRTRRNYMLMGAAGACSLLAAGLLIQRLWSRDSSSSSSQASSSSGGGAQTFSSPAGTAANSSSTGAAGSLQPTAKAMPALLRGVSAASRVQR